MHKHRSLKRRRKNGFTLLEILVVLLIVGLLLGTVGTNVFRALFAGQSKQAENQIRLFHTALNEFKVQNYRLPDSLEELTEPDSSGEPFMDRVPLDPWEREYDYEITPDGPMITCYGEDGSPGGDGKAADISSETLGLMRSN